MRCGVALAALLLLGGPSAAAKYTQRYLRIDGRPPARPSNADLWTRPKDGPARCLYEARDAKGNVVSRQMLIHFRNAATAGDKDRCNWWVYWYNTDKKTVWGRCPTPKHPMYKQWQKAAKGEDLWQVIPPDKRQKDVTRIGQVAANFGKVFS